MISNRTDLIGGVWPSTNELYADILHHITDPADRTLLRNSFPPNNTPLNWNNLPLHDHNAVCLLMRATAALLGMSLLGTA